MRASALIAFFAALFLNACGGDEDADDFELFGGPGADNANGGGRVPFSGVPMPGSAVPVPLDDVQGGRESSPEGRLAHVVQPFVRARHDPFSTFSADVDSASYDIFVKALHEQDRLPAPAEVRTEEFVNFFRYDYAEVRDGSRHPFGIDIQVGPIPGEETFLLRIGIQGRDLLQARKRANLVFLIDVSGSMAPRDKLPLVKRMLEEALSVLRPTDTVSLVTYSGEVRRALGPTSVEQAEQIISVLRGLEAAGGTAGGDGLQLAYDEAQAGFVAGGINHIVLCTDGDFNIGPYTNDELVAIVEARRREGVSLTALGFGLGNLNDGMMEAISNAGNGIYRVIRGMSSARRYVEERLLSDVVHIAKDVKVQVELNPERVVAYRQIGYDNRQLLDEEFRDDQVDAGEVGAGHQMTGLYELALEESAVPSPPGAPPVVDGAPVEGERTVDPADLVVVKLRYKSPDAVDEDNAEEIRVSFGSAAVSSILDGESRFALAVATLAERLREDPYQSPSRIALARSVLEAARSSPRADRRTLSMHAARVFEMLR